ncbi:hypothetical protein FIBSPDRAFT_861781 [Athelia psychrophila]|uniref:Uncharacterized protein n=1 Tax=Athelia psychrophila TaxID=1759441 RepID=A0A166IX22_9AGAM|nr:hypothetical protein FIBSPDRAFT_861781 [Fibularhizoctonia sp. CBS 109695]
MSPEFPTQPADHFHPMEWIPIEVWRPIFMMACVDDGSTGCSLSRVSKYIHEVSSPFRYYSIGIKGLASALLFVELLERSPDIRITHLLFTNDPRHAYSVVANTSSPIQDNGFAQYVLVMRDWIMTMLPATFNQRYFENATSAEGGQRRDIVREALNGERFSKAANGLLMAAIRAILTSQSKSLLTLSIAYDFTGHKAFELPCLPGLPQLQELTVTIRPFPTDLGAKVFDLLPPLNGMPALRRLNMLGMTSSMLPQEILLECAEHCAELTHVCLPVLGAHNLHALAFSLEATIRVLKARFGSDSESEEQVEAAPKFPLNIVVQADPWEIKPSRSHTLLIPFIRSTVDIHPECLRVHQRAILIDGSAQEQENNWKDRILGGEGGWEPTPNHRQLGVCGTGKVAY